MANIPQVGDSHYQSFTIQPWEYIVKNNIGWSEGEVIKYVSRWKNKNGVEDLRKAKSVIDNLIAETLQIEKQTPKKVAKPPVVEYHLTENEYLGID